MDKNKKILLIGGGKMGSALLGGWLQSGLSTKQFCVQEPNPAAALTALGVDVVPQAQARFFTRYCGACHQTANGRASDT